MADGLTNASRVEKNATGHNAQSFLNRHDYSTKDGTNVDLEIMAETKKSMFTPDWWSY